MIKALSPLLMSYLPQHKYISIADIQIKNEEELEKCPMSLVSQGGPAQQELCLQCCHSMCTAVGLYCVPGKARSLLS